MVNTEIWACFIYLFLFVLFEGLAYLHGQRSIAHRDVKSSNVLVDGCCCKVADFGLAISFADGMERDSRSTQTQVRT